METSLDAVTHVLGFENHLSDCLDPFLSAWDRVGGQDDGLLIGPKTEVSFTDRFTGNGISQIYNTMRKIGILK
jgi:hypothetical protein